MTTQLTYTFSGLVPGSSYFVRFFARNAVGWSGSSPLSPLTTLKFSAPRMVYFTALTRSSSSALYSVKLTFATATNTPSINLLLPILDVVPVLNCSFNATWFDTSNLLFTFLPPISCVPPVGILRVRIYSLFGILNDRLDSVTVSGLSPLLTGSFIPPGSILNVPSLITMQEDTVLTFKQFSLNLSSSDPSTYVILINCILGVVSPPILTGTAASLLTVFPTVQYTPPSYFYGEASLLISFEAANSSLLDYRTALLGNSTCESRSCYNFPLQSSAEFGSSHASAKLRAFGC